MMKQFSVSKANEHRVGVEGLLLAVVGLLGLLVFTVRMVQSYDHWQGDERTYASFADRVADGHLPFVDWSPGFTLVYSPLFAMGLDDAIAQLIARVLFSVLLLVLVGMIVWRVTRDRRLTAISMLAAGLHPMLSVGMTVRIFTAVLLVAPLLAITYKGKGLGIALIILAFATLARPEVWIVYVLVLAIAALWYRSELDLGATAVSLAVAIGCGLFVLFGPEGSNFAGGRALQAIGQHYAIYAAMPGVNVWNEWHIPFRRDFGDSTTALQMLRENREAFGDYLWWNIQNIPNTVLEAYRISDRQELTKLAGVSVFLMLALASVRWLRDGARRPEMTVVYAVAVFAMALPWPVTGMDVSPATAWAPIILVLAALAVKRITGRSETKESAAAEFNPS